MLFSILRMAKKTTARIRMSFLRGLMLEGKGDTNQIVFHIHCIFCNSIRACWNCIPACVFVGVWKQRWNNVAEEPGERDISLLDRHWLLQPLSLKVDFHFFPHPFLGLRIRAQEGSGWLWCQKGGLAEFSIDSPLKSHKSAPLLGREGAPIFPWISSHPFGLSLFKLPFLSTPP